MVERGRRSSRPRGGGGTGHHHPLGLWGRVWAGRVEGYCGGLPGGLQCGRGPGSARRGLIVSDTIPTNLCDRLLALNAEAFAAGHWEVAYHALMAALHLAADLRDENA